MQFTTVRSKEKDYEIYLKSEKLVHSQQEHKKNVLQLFQKNWFTGTKKMFCSYLDVEKTGVGKNWFLDISSLKNTVAALWRE